MNLSRRLVALSFLLAGGMVLCATSGESLVPAVPVQTVKIEVPSGYDGGSSIRIVITSPSGPVVLPVVSPQVENSLMPSPAPLVQVSPSPENSQPIPSLPEAPVPSGASIPMEKLLEIPIKGDFPSLNQRGVSNLEAVYVALQQMEQASPVPLGVSKISSDLPLRVSPEPLPLSPTVEVSSEMQKTLFEKFKEFIANLFSKKPSASESKPESKPENKKVPSKGKFSKEVPSVTKAEEAKKVVSSTNGASPDSSAKALPAVPEVVQEGQKKVPSVSQPSISQSEQTWGQHFVDNAAVYAVVTAVVVYGTYKLVTYLQVREHARKKSKKLFATRLREAHAKKMQEAEVEIFE